MQIQTRLFSRSKSVPLEQMVLEAGDRPLPHLNLDSSAHPQPGSGAQTVFQLAQSSIDKAGFISRYVDAVLVGCAFRKCCPSIFSRCAGWNSPLMSSGSLQISVNKHTLCCKYTSHPGCHRRNALGVILIRQALSSNI